MDSTFTFPRPQAPVARPAPLHNPKSGSKSSTTSSTSNPAPRESSALRASVLDAALELGIGSNPLMADWMFNNTLAEEDEVGTMHSFFSLCIWTSSFSSSFLMSTPAPRGGNAMRHLVILPIETGGQTNYFLELEVARREPAGLTSGASCGRTRSITLRQCAPMAFDFS